MAVEAQRDPGGSLPGPGIFEVHIIQQVVAARSLDQVQAADALAGDHPMAGAGLLAVGTATDAVGVVLLAHQLQTAAGGGGLELGVGAVGGEIAGFAGIGIAGDQGRGDGRAGNADLAALGQAGGIDGLLGGQVYIVGAALAGVAGDVGNTAGGEGGTVKVHAAAQRRGGVAGDGGAAEVQDNIAGVIGGRTIDGAAVTVGGVVLDGAVLNVHGHSTAGEDGAALRVVSRAGGGAAGDGGALHGEGDGAGRGAAPRFIDHGNGAAPVAGGAVLDGATLFHDQLTRGHIDGGTVAGGSAVLDGSALAQGQLRVIGAGHKNECVFGRYSVLVAVQDDVLEGQLTSFQPERILTFIVVCAGLEGSGAKQLIGAALLASYGDVLL